MRSLDHLNRKELVDLLNKCWMTHDGMWFLHSLQHHGINAANQANKAAISSLAGIEVDRLKKTLGFDDGIKTAETFKRFFRISIRSAHSGFHEYKMAFPRQRQTDMGV
ncbi:MAG: hypothetical protein JEZ12_24365 [Desulfobacterium sp.]|nr:hypothetical protein [Desulfobacterium sp.]